VEDAAVAEDMAVVAAMAAAEEGDMAAAATAGLDATK
jgi:hypothetical protein